MIGITLGDPGGIGIEVVLKALSNFNSSVILLGNKNALLYYSRKLNLRIPKKAEIKDIKGKFFEGKLCKENGDIAYRSIIEAINKCKEGICDCLVTAPINKKALNLAGYDYPGHTELLAEKFSCDRYAMMMVGDDMKVLFITTHIPIKNVTSSLTKELIKEKIKLANHNLKHYWRIPNPSFGILALNPHAGDSGLFGGEEDKIIKPAINELIDEGYNIEGPFSSDTYWVTQKKDCTVALYHDQGMIPFKMKNMGKGVNITLGLPFPRTSPDHGTAFDIAGRGIADSGSMLKAIKTAYYMSRV
jgi:4-hydroxythreonine-4-phosphate dehydrogenase